MKHRLLFHILLAGTLILPSCGPKPVQEYRVRTVREFPHDSTSYTQGLFFRDGRLYESTGQWGESSFREVELETGKALNRKDFGKEYFVEGSVMLGDVLYILTWTSHVLFKYDAKTLAYIGAEKYPRQGWGLTTDGTSLIASDGSSNLYFLDPETLATQRKVKVRMNDRPVHYLNELEWIDGKVWANVYLTDNIVVIDPRSGQVEARIDCKGLLPKELREARTDVLNGIAVNAGHIYLTGKYWRRLYEVELEKK